MTRIEFWTRSPGQTKTSQVRAGDLRTKGPVLFITYPYYLKKTAKNLVCCMGDTLNIHLIRPQKYIICENFHFLTLKVQEIQPGDRPTAES